LRETSRFLGLIFNGDSSNNYGGAVIEACGTNCTITNIETGSPAPQNRCVIFEPTLTAVGSNWGFFDLLIYAKTGINRGCFCNAMDEVSGTNVNYIRNSYSIWNNYTSTVSSITIYNAGSIAPGTRLQLWSKY
jgi:hypothetical protein